MLELLVHVYAAAVVLVVFVATPLATALLVVFIVNIARRS